MRPAEITARATGLERERAERLSCGVGAGSRATWARRHHRHEHHRRWPASFDRDAVRRLTAYVFGALDLWLAPRSPADVVLVHGACERSPDVIAASWAQHRGVRVQAFPVTEAEWQEKGPIAGPLRNERMAAFCATGGEVAVIAFYDGASRGTANMLARAEARGWRPIVLRPELLQRR